MWQTTNDSLVKADAVNKDEERCVGLGVLIGRAEDARDLKSLVGDVVAGNIFLRKVAHLCDELNAVKGAHISTLARLEPLPRKRSSLQGSNSALVIFGSDTHGIEVEHRPVGRRHDGVVLPLAVCVRDNVRFVTGELRDHGGGRGASGGTCGCGGSCRGVHGHRHWVCWHAASCGHAGAGLLPRQDLKGGRGRCLACEQGAREGE